MNGFCSHPNSSIPDAGVPLAEGCTGTCTAFKSLGASCEPAYLDADCDKRVAYGVHQPGQVLLDYSRSRGRIA